MHTILKEPTYLFLIDRLLELGCDCDDPWGVGFNIRMINMGNSEERYPNITTVCNAEWHAGRIRYLLNHQEEIEPIWIESVCYNNSVLDTVDIIDGWHRFFLYRYLGKKKIESTFGGIVRICEYLRGARNNYEKY